MPLSLSKLLDDLRLSLARRHANRNKLIDFIQNWAAKHGHEAMLSADTWNSYREDADIDVHLQTVLILVEFFHSQTKRPGSAATRFEQKCQTILRSARGKRFQRSVGQDPSLRKEDVDRHAGAYAIFRVESEHGNPCQELLLIHPAEGNAKARFATIVGRNLVVRGHWHLLGNSIHVTGLGFRLGHLPDFLTLSFLESDEVAGGVLTGLGTSRREPVTMSIIVMTLKEVEQDLRSIGDESDARLLKEFRSVVPRMLTEPQRSIFAEVQKQVYGDEKIRHDDWLAQKLITSADPFVTCVRSRDTRELIDDGLMKFCRKFR